MLLKRGFAAPKFGALFAQPGGESFGGHEAFAHGGKFGAAGGEFILFRLNGSAKLDERFREPGAFGVGFCAGQCRGGRCRTGDHLFAG